MANIFKTIGNILNPKDRLSDVGDESPDKKLIDFIFKTLYTEAVKFDAPFKRNREDNRRFYKGDQWRRSQPSDKSKSVTNFLSLIIRDEVAILTDALPEINVRPVDFNGDPDKAMMLKKLICHILYLQNFQTKLYKAVKWASIENICYLRPVWNPLLSDGMGDVEILVEKADSIKMDPSGEFNYFIIEKKVTMAEIARLYPDKFDQVKLDKQDRTSVADASTNKNPPRPVTSTDGSETVFYDKPPMTIQEQMDKVDFHIVWMRDDSVKALDPDKDSVAPDPVPMYPHGRWITIANRRTILKDDECKTRTFPIIPLILDADPETEINGISTIDYCKQQQIDYNEMRALQKDWLRASVFLRYTYDPKKGLDPKRVKNRWGGGVPMAPGDFRWDPPGQLPNESWRDGDVSKANIEYVSGINDVMQGRRPPSVQSAEAIRLLTESSKTILRPKARLIEGAVKQLGQLLIDYIQAGYTTERMMRVLGYDNSNGEQMTFNSPQVQGNVDSIKNDITLGEYDVYVTPDSTLPKSDIERFDKLAQLGQMNFVDRTALLSVSGLENWQEIDQRMQKKEDEFKAQQDMGKENEQLKQQLQQMGQQMQQLQAQAQQGQNRPPNESINFKDLPPAGKVAMAQQVGIDLSGVNPAELVTPVKGVGAP